MSNTSRIRVIASALLLCAASAPLYSQTPGTTPQQSQGGIDIINWDQAELRGGFSANRLIGLTVRGSKGESIGKVENILVNDQGKATAIVVESGGFLDIGDGHFRIPWNDMKVADNLDHVVVPLRKDTARQYRELRDKEKVKTGPREYRVSELRNDIVKLRDGTQYGQVDDLIISRSGEVKAIVVEGVAATGRARYVYPYRPDVFAFNIKSYQLPYERTQINSLKPFDYRAVNIAEPRVRARAATGGTGATGSGTSGGTRIHSPGTARGGTAGEERRERQPARQSKG